MSSVKNIFSFRNLKILELCMPKNETTFCAVKIRRGRAITLLSDQYCLFIFPYLIKSVLFLSTCHQYRTYSVSDHLLKNNVIIMVTTIIII